MNSGSAETTEEAGSAFLLGGSVLDFVTELGSADRRGTSNPAPAADTPPEAEAVCLSMTLASKSK